MIVLIHFSSGKEIRLDLDRHEFGKIYDNIEHCEYIKAQDLIIFSNKIDYISVEGK